MKNQLSFLGLVLAFSLAISCTGSALDLTKYKAYPNIEYKNVNGKPLLLDLYVNPSITWSMPLVIYIHGGGWSGRTRQDGLFYAEAFLKKGYAYASIDYRLSTEAPFPAQIEDSKAAVRYLRAHAGDYHIAPDQIGVMGHSAGGHLASLLGTTNDDTQFDTGDNLNVSSAVQSVCDMSGPVDFLYPAPALAPLLTKLLGGPVSDKGDLAKLASPIDHVSAKSVPFIILHGASDPSVPKEESIAFSEALKKAGVPVQLVLLPGQPHNLNVYAHTGGGNFLDMVVKFFDSTLKHS